MTNARVSTIEEIYKIATNRILERGTKVVLRFVEEAIVDPSITKDLSLI